MLGEVTLVMIGVMWRGCTGQEKATEGWGVCQMAGGKDSVCPEKGAAEIMNHRPDEVHSCVSFLPLSALFLFLPQPIAATINTLAGALYQVFCASSDKAMTEMRQVGVGVGGMGRGGGVLNLAK